MDAIPDPGLVLKITPPKLRKGLLVRERLRRIGASGDDVAVILVEAPAGYGKTSLLAQWRLDWLHEGAAVAWLNLDAGDSPITLVTGIALGLRRSMARSNFGIDAIEVVRRGAGTATALTSLLAEITEASRPMVLVLDNGERIGDADAVEVLDYLLHNLPPNLRVVIGARPQARAETLDLLGQGLLRRVTAADLCFDLPEAIQLLTARLNGQIDADLCARLHDIAGGWPLGLQLAAAALERAADPGRAIEAFSKSHDDATQHLFESLIGSMPKELADFLTRCALLDSLHPSLCEAATGDDDAGLSLQRLVFETPLLSATEEGEWLRLHPLAREYLRSRAEKMLSAQEHREIHVRAWRWLAAHGFLERAAQHALAAGCRAEALELISVSLRDEFDRGHHGQVIEWLARIPQAAIESNVQLRLVALWMHALAHHPGDTIQQATALIDDPTLDEAVRSEAMIALAVVADLLDRHDEARHYVSLCGAAAAGSRTRQVMAHLQADFACNAGQTERCRRLLVPMADERITPVVQIWRDFLTVWSYLLEGRPVLAEQFARVQHTRWEAQVGRRGPWTALLGGVLAAACWQQDLRSDARALLANRLDVIEQGSAYGGLISAYQTLARMAAFERDEARAFAYLEALAAIGEGRGTVRLVVASLAERVRLHAARQRPAQAAALLTELSAAVDRSAVSDLLAPQLRLDLEMARTFVAVAANDLGGAQGHLAAARQVATDLNRGYEAVQILALQALLAERAGESPVAALIEAVSRAGSGGLVRVFADTLPEVVDLVRRRLQGTAHPSVSRVFLDRVLAAAEAVHEIEQQTAPLAGGALLTPKESAVLRLLAGGLPNKRIATELELSSETVKWHVKKLLAKLNAGNRDHAVERARMLGLLR
jgi:LuxR family transcriptional regulator, maltose regulon positive regulatory protein